MRIDGQVVNDLPPKDRDIAMVFQNYALYPHMNAAKNMGFALKMRGLPKEEIDSRVREAARILGLTDSLHKKPRTLSGGQRQRVAMGRAIVRNPQAFLMDEPLSNLDAKLRVEMRAEIARIQRDLGVTTIYVTHDQTEAMTMGDRVAVMRSGLLQQIADPKALYERPRNLFVAEFIGSPAMNLVVADVERVGRRRLGRASAPHRLRLEPTTLEHHPGLAAYEGRRVILGIRPEDMEDAALARETHPDRQLSVVCDIREDMGSEVYVHFNVAADAGDDAARSSRRSSSRPPRTRRRAWPPSSARGGGVSFIARLDRATRGARARAARARGRRHAAPLLRPGDGDGRRREPGRGRVLADSDHGGRISVRDDDEAERARRRSSAPAPSSGSSCAVTSSRSPGATATTTSSAGKVASASRIASAMFASPAAVSTSSAGSSAARSSATRAACENARSSFASQSSRPCFKAGTTTFTWSFGPTAPWSASSSCSAVVTTRT